MPQPPAGIQALERWPASTQPAETCVSRSLLAPRERQLPSNSNEGGAGGLVRRPTRCREGRVRRWSRGDDDAAVLLKMVLRLGNQRQRVGIPRWRLSATL